MPVWAEMDSHNEAEAPGYVDGLHYTEHVETVKVLKRADDLAKAEALLLRLIEATRDREPKRRLWGCSVVLRTVGDRSR